MRNILLEDYVRIIPDYPKPGIMFRDITTLIGNAHAFRYAIEQLAAPYRGKRIDTIVGIEARGFIFGAALAQQLCTGFVPIRKKGKLPHTTLSASYDLEYGTDTIEIHADAIAANQRVLLVDDLIATGGTAASAISLLRQMGAEMIASLFVIDLPELGGSEKLRALGVPVHTLVTVS